MGETGRGVECTFVLKGLKGISGTCGQIIRDQSMISTGNRTCVAGANVLHRTNQRGTPGRENPFVGPRFTAALLHSMHA